MALCTTNGEYIVQLGKKAGESCIFKKMIFFMVKKVKEDIFSPDCTTSVFLRIFLLFGTSLLKIMRI